MALDIYRRIYLALLAGRRDAELAGRIDYAALSANGLGDDGDQTDHHNNNDEEEI